MPSGTITPARPLGLDGEAVVRPDAAFGRHEWGIGHDHVAPLIPALLTGEGVVFVDDGIRKAVKIQVHAGQTHHVGCGVIAPEVGHEPGALIRGQGIVDCGLWILDWRFLPVGLFSSQIRS